ncbi:MAG: flagellar basal-body rod protein FlgB [Deltaproteobacteria bacterium GWC2_56_8]|nr:MAG: flagellar basal-body rod protein FlgB [Deltaproteobacteria bacterium GWB2_55_19]OGP33671.1 MAG: flagellar basal-body rod protein FlgB [Deltaproteobacteria bacterium GWC2_56_8]HAO93681.1 flagellar basal body rod protein FlgB [Deltaproteobacteria bacterium]
MPDGIFDSTISLLGNTLDLRAARHKLLSSNIANQETPGYRAVDINFEEELEKRAGKGVLAGDTEALARTSPLHLSPTSGIGSEPRVLDRATEIEGYDRNSVGVEGEMAKLSENSLMYTISSKMIRSKFNLLMTAIKEGGR